jgi:hypothetical protein
MASIPTQDEVLAATRKSQEAMTAALRTWLETVRAATPKLTSVYGALPKLPPVTLPFADRLPTPEEVVGSAYHMAEQLLANQRKFAEDLVQAVTPLLPGYRQGAPETPSRSAWREAVAADEPKPAAVSEPKPVAVDEPQPIAAVASATPKPAPEPEPASAPEPTHPAAKSAPARSAAGTTAARSAAGGNGAKSGTARSTAGKSTAGKSGAGKSTPKRTTADRAPKGTDAS